MASWWSCPYRAWKPNYCEGHEQEVSPEPAKVMKLNSSVRLIGASPPASVRETLATAQTRSRQGRASAITLPIVRCPLAGGRSRELALYTRIEPAPF